MQDKRTFYEFFERTLVNFLRQIMKKVKSKMYSKPEEVRKSQCLTDKQIIKRQLGYSSSGIYDTVLKYRHQNYLNKQSKQS